MVQDLWDFQVKAIIDVKIGDADEDSYKYEPIAALLSRLETIKMDKHSKHFHDQGKKNSPFILSVDGMLGSYVRNYRLGPYILTWWDQ